ncbi:hypothetical protein V8B97DRAFT_1136361 [Scleroderma yunnanense]
MNLFGATKHLKDYTGDIVFFKQLASAMVLNGSCFEQGLDDATNGQTSLLENILGPFQPIVDCFVIKESRIQNLVTTMLNRMSIDQTGTYYQKDWASQKRNLAQKVEEISQNLCVNLLQVISDIYVKSQELYQLGCRESANNDICHGRNNRTIDMHDIQLLAMEVKECQQRLDVAQNVDEHHAIEEDMIGKILLVFWKGICSEVEQVVSNVVARIINDTTVHPDVLSCRAALLQDLGEILENARAGLPDDYQVRLWQIMQDARSGISKHEIQLVQPTAPEKVR